MGRQGIHREVGDTWGVRGDMRRHTVRKHKKTGDNVETGEGTGRLGSDRET